MYDDLIEKLKSSCRDCKLWDGHECCLDGDCTGRARLQAADAIEKLEAYCDLYKECGEKLIEAMRRIKDGDGA